ncbi:YaaA family protein [Homoserinibacter sp. YIM 151385]|uniref:YaaA family protein n=1 Tax=Homoserinibacter sp. YIM 151385 TaxID=2985506 RepID=UPI0022F1049F|nr:peroxide stress protein YaaA [Homoserinibacter sp. YIM 151385]WBU38295.1 peroxide stress protein YaaA [Homoserinibacter sp. YIM 151385]
MLLLLPPSETKREGGPEGTALDLDALSFPQLASARRAALAELRALSTNLETAAAALKLGPKGAPEAAKNRVVRSSPVLPALDRFDGVLFDALEAGRLTAAQREFAARHVAVHSALFGLLGALDPIPSYRLSHDSRLPGRTLKGIWRERTGELLAAHPGLIIDARSEGYAALGPLPRRPDAVFLRVVSEDAGGRKRALNHFNKQAKGRFARAIVESGEVHEDVAGLLAWAARSGWRLETGAPGELDLVV